jgi:hypothetical protein
MQLAVVSSKSSRKVPTESAWAPRILRGSMNGGIMTCTCSFAYKMTDVRTMYYRNTDTQLQGTPIAACGTPKHYENAGVDSWPLFSFSMITNTSQVRHSSHPRLLYEGIREAKSKVCTNQADLLLFQLQKPIPNTPLLSSQPRNSHCGKFQQGTPSSWLSARARSTQQERPLSASAEKRCHKSRSTPSTRWATAESTSSTHEPPSVMRSLDDFSVGLIV